MVVEVWLKKEYYKLLILVPMNFSLKYESNQKRIFLHNNNYEQTMCCFPIENN